MPGSIFTYAVLRHNELSQDSEELLLLGGGGAVKNRKQTEPEKLTTWAPAPPCCAWVDPLLWSSVRHRSA